MSRLTRDGTAEPVFETKFSGANGDGEIFIFPVQLTTCRIGNLTVDPYSCYMCDQYITQLCYIELEIGLEYCRKYWSPRCHYHYFTVFIVPALS